MDDCDDDGDLEPKTPSLFWDFRKIYNDVIPPFNCTEFPAFTTKFEDKSLKLKHHPLPFSGTQHSAY